MDPPGCFGACPPKSRPGHLPVAADSPGGDLAGFAALALAHLEREYPSHLQHRLAGDGDVAAPRVLHPAFFGCFDWHSAVHNHWLLARLARLYPAARFAPEARAALSRRLTPANIAVEVRYLEAEGRGGFERPYGLAWVLKLASELRAWDASSSSSAAAGAPEAVPALAALAPLETLAADRLGRYFAQLRHPVRSGEHAQTAFALGLLLDWEQGAQAAASREGAGEKASRRSRDRAIALHGGDRDLPLHLEPSDQDFLSPSLAAADLMRRVLPPHELKVWLDRALPGIPREASARWLAPVEAVDPADGKLAHLDGLNLSRAWMLEAVARALPEEDPRRGALLAAAAPHRRRGLDAVGGAPYAGAHWLPTFAVYLVTHPAAL